MGSDAEQLELLMATFNTHEEAVQEESTANVQDVEAIEKESTIKEFVIGDLEENVLELLMSKLTVAEQIAIARVSKRFDKAALKLTTKWYADTVPKKARSKLISRMPKLRKVYLLGVNHDNYREFQSFVKKLATKNQSIERILCHGYNLKLIYIESVRKVDHNYDGTKFKSVLLEPDYESNCFIPWYQIAPPSY